METAGQENAPKPERFEKPPVEAAEAEPRLENQEGEVIFDETEGEIVVFEDESSAQMKADQEAAAAAEPLLELADVSEVTGWSKMNAEAAGMTRRESAAQEELLTEAAETVANPDVSGNLPTVEELVAPEAAAGQAEQPRAEAEDAAVPDRRRDLDAKLDKLDGQRSQIRALERKLKKVGRAEAIDFPGGSRGKESEMASIKAMIDGLKVKMAEQTAAERKARIEAMGARVDAAMAKEDEEAAPAAAAVEEKLGESGAREIDLGETPTEELELAEPYKPDETISLEEWRAEEERKKQGAKPGAAVESEEIFTAAELAALDKAGKELLEKAKQGEKPPEEPKKQRKRVEAWSSPVSESVSLGSAAGTSGEGAKKKREPFHKKFDRWLGKISKGISKFYGFFGLK